MNDLSPEPRPHDESVLSPFAMLDKAIGLLNQARIAIPSVNYALGVVGVELAGFIVWFFLQNVGSSILVIFGMFVAMIVLFVFAVASRPRQEYRKYIDIFGILLIATVTIFFCAILVLAFTSWRLTGLRDSLAFLVAALTAWKINQEKTGYIPVVTAFHPCNSKRRPIR